MMDSIAVFAELAAYACSEGKPREDCDDTPNHHTRIVRERKQNGNKTETE
ncbi:TPA: hypothetical protein HA251_05095 [Candidatus Woesearchaeota archaeon]|nr:hypothetical protein [Candidatus Woesearchaeota archaeon]